MSPAATECELAPLRLFSDTRHSVMQSIVLDKPYRFVPPDHGTLGPRLIGMYLPRYLDRSHGIVDITFHGTERLTKSIQAGHGIILAPNHCRPCDPMVICMLAKEMGTPFFTMASAHLFMQGRLQAWLLQKAGAFSVYREGMDRQALAAAIQILESAERPLVLFPEGIVTRANDALGHIQDGVSFIARSAAKKRRQADATAETVVHPVAIRYRFRGDATAAAASVLSTIETRLSWRPQLERPIAERIFRVGEALLSLKEKEYMGEARTGLLSERLRVLIDHILHPLENEWLGGCKTDPVVTRVKQLRSKILPDLVGKELPEEERARRWRLLADLYLVQQLALYPPDYADEYASPERLLETVERFEEDLTDVATVHRPFEASVTIGEAIIVGVERPARGESDPLTAQLESQLRSLLSIPGSASEA